MISNGPSFIHLFRTPSELSIPARCNLSPAVSCCNVILIPSAARFLEPCSFSVLAFLETSLVHPSNCALVPFALFTPPPSHYQSDLDHLL